MNTPPSTKTVVGLGIGATCLCSAVLGYRYWKRRRRANTPLVAGNDVLPSSTVEKLDAITIVHQVVLLMRQVVPIVLPNSSQKTVNIIEQETARDELVDPKALSSTDQYTNLTVAKIQRGSKLQEGWQLTKAAVTAWIDDFAPSMGAAIAYYTMFSLAPMLIIAIAVAGFIFGQEAAQGEIVNQIRGLVGNEGAIAIQGLIKSANEPATGIMATVISVITLVIGSTAVFAELQSALDRIWRVPTPAKESGIWNLLRTRLLSFGLILGLGFMLMVSLVVSAALSAVGNWWGAWLEGWDLVLQALNLVLSFVVFAGLFSVIYKFMPRVSLSWHDVRIGAVVTAALFICGKYLIGLYLGTAGVASAFGAAGSFALLLVWIYYSAQIFLLGAEFTWIYANNFGSKRYAELQPTN